MITILLSTLLGARRWTQMDLSRVTKIRPNTINDLYHEMTVRVSLEQLDLICEALNCKLTDLIVWEPNTVPKLNQADLKTLDKKG
jgi:Predicted transcriptional regulator